MRTAHIVSASHRIDLRVNKLRLGKTINHAMTAKPKRIPRQAMS